MSFHKVVEIYLLQGESVVDRNGVKWTGKERSAKQDRKDLRVQERMEFAYCLFPITDCHNYHWSFTLPKSWIPRTGRMLAYCSSSLHTEENEKVGPDDPTF
jgi:hypothetical protein